MDPAGHKGTQLAEDASPAFAQTLRRGRRDAEAERRMCEALRSAGIEVWLDQEGGLVGPPENFKARRRGNQGTG